MPHDRDIAGGLAIRVKFALKFFGYTGAAVVLYVIIMLFVNDTTEKTDRILGFVSSSFVMSAALGGLISLGNLFFGNPDSRVSDRLLHPAFFAGLVAGGLIGLSPFFIDRGSHTGMTPGSWALLALILSSPMGFAFGAIIAFKSNFPRLGEFILAGTIGVLAAIASMA